MDRTRINTIIDNENRIGLAFYDEERDVMVTVPKRGRSGFGRVACYIWHNASIDEADLFWEEYEIAPEWIDVKKGRPKYPPATMQVDISLDEIHAFEGLVTKK